MEVYSEERIRTKVKKQSERTTPSSSSVSRVEQINLYLVKKTTFNDRLGPEFQDSFEDFVMTELGPYFNDLFNANMVLEQLRPDFVVDQRQECQENFVVINHSQVLDSATTHETIKKELNGWDVSENCREEFINEVLCKTRDLLEAISPGHNILDVRATLYSERNRVISLAYATDLFMDLVRWMDDDDIVDLNLIPATDSSIESLERKTMMNCGSCSICLEEYDDGCEVACMPCSHVFHVYCIATWLRISHYCPICRFEGNGSSIPLLCSSPCPI